MPKEEKEKLFLFLKRCEDQNKTLLETFALLKLTGAVSLSEAFDIIEEYRKQKHEKED